MEEDKIYLDDEQCTNPTLEFKQKIGDVILNILNSFGILEDDEYALTFKKVNKNKLDKIRASLSEKKEV